MIVHEGHISLVSSVAYSPDGKSVVSGSYDNTVRMWNAHGSSSIGEPLRGHSDFVYSVSYSPRGDLIASASYDETIRLWDPSTGQQSGEALKSDNPLFCVAFSPDGKLIASGSGGPSTSSTGCAVQLWDVRTRKAVSGPFKGHTSFIWSVSFASDGARLVSGSHDKTIRIWDAERGTAITGPLQGHTDTVRSSTFSPDGTRILSCSHDGTIRFWDARNGGMIGEPYTGHAGAVWSAAFSPCGTYVTSGGDDKTVRVWDVRTSRQVDQSFEEHTDAVLSVAYLPCGQYIASGSHDRKVIIRRALGGDPDSDSDGPQVSTSKMSTRQMFECLRDAGCVDFSSQIDSRQETFINVSGGAFGDIWQGKMNNGAKAAIKVWRANPLEQSDQTALARAAHELFELSRTNHPNVHRMLGVMMFKGLHLGVVSEWVDHSSLYEYIMKYPDADRFQLCTQVASVLDYMHRRGKVHGDLKAVNIAVSSDGIAKLGHLDSSIMSEGSCLVFHSNSTSWPGTFRWMAPELLLEEVQQKTTQTDVYALGMTILEIFSGQPPYTNCRSDISVIRTVERGTLPTRPITLENNRKNDKMWGLLVRCWSRSPSERPSSGYVAAALEFMS